MAERAAGETEPVRGICSTSAEGRPCRKHEKECGSLWEERLGPADSRKETGNSVLQPRGLYLANNLNALGSKIIPQNVGKELNSAD